MSITPSHQLFPTPTPPLCTMISPLQTAVLPTAHRAARIQGERHPCTRGPERVSACSSPEPLATPVRPPSLALDRTCPSGLSVLGRKLQNTSQEFRGQKNEHHPVPVWFPSSQDQMENLPPAVQRVTERGAPQGATPTQARENIVINVPSGGKGRITTWGTWFNVGLQAPGWGLCSVAFEERSEGTDSQPGMFPQSHTDGA